jgi:hypothetical protein
MSYLVVTTFEVESGQKREADRVRRTLGQLGLHEYLVDRENEKHELPGGTLAGLFDGASASQLHTQIRTRAKAALKSSRVSARVYVSVGRALTWGKYEDAVS